MAVTYTVLVVEDDGLIRTLLAEMLRAEGIAVQTASHGREALAILQQWRPDLILLDLDMPEMDGRAFRAEQRRRPPLATIPVIVLSAASNLAGRVAGLEATDILSKPCDLEVLMTVVWRVIGR